MSYRYTPIPPWTLKCHWCNFNILVYARGQQGADDGSGVEASNLMENHIVTIHQKTWKEFVKRLSRD